VSQTITAVPARDGTATPWQSAVQMAKLAAYRKAAIAAFLGAADRLLQYLKDRACGQLLVECPTVKDRKVYLADVSFQGGKVYQICNFHHRKYVHTFPTVEYWMSIVPILPALKTLVEKVCCSVIAGSAGKLAAALTAAAKGDLFPATALRNAIVRLKAANPVEQMQKLGSRGEMVGRYAKAQLERTLRLPGPGAPAGQTSATDVIDHPAADAAQIAAAKGIQVRHVEIASGTPSALLAMFTAPSVGTGDTVDLITDAGGRVIAWKKVSAEGAAQPSDEVVALRRDLARMTVAHDQQAAAVTEMQHKLEEMAAAIAALHR
jgi:hypothetical protein